MSKVIVALVVAAVVIFSVVPCFAQETVTTEDSTLTVLQKDVQGLKKSSEQIQQDIDGLGKANVETQKKLGQVEENLGRKIEDSQAATGERLDQVEKTGQALGDNLRKVEENLGRKIDDSETRTQEKLGQISGGVKKVFYLIITLVVVFAMAYSVVQLKKRLPKNIPVVIEDVEVEGVKKTFKVLVKYHKGIYTSPFTATTGNPINLKKDSLQEMKSSLKNCLKKSGSGGIFENQMATLIKEGKIKEIR